MSGWKNVCTAFVAESAGGLLASLTRGVAAAELSTGSLQIHQLCRRRRRPTVQNARKVPQSQKCDATVSERKEMGACHIGDLASGGCVPGQTIVQELTNASFGIVLRAPRSTADEANVSPAFMKFDRQPPILARDFHDIIEHCFGQEWIIASTQKQRRSTNITQVSQ
jgi:hypothetical protein